MFRSLNKWSLSRYQNTEFVFFPYIQANTELSENNRFTEALCRSRRYCHDTSCPAGSPTFSKRRAIVAQQVGAQPVRYRQ